MRVLAIVDIHKAENALKDTLIYFKKFNPELILILGDITTFRPLDFAEDFLAKLPDVTIFALPGNCDPREVLSVIDKSKALNLHGKKITIENVTFVGLGGSNSTPFNTPFELSETEIYQKLDELMEPGVILALHFPIKGHLDEVPGGGHTGSEGALKIVKKYQPSLVISGHIHETRGTESDENGILYLNPGPMRDGFAAIIDINATETRTKYKYKIQMLP